MKIPPALLAAIALTSVAIGTGTVPAAEVSAGDRSDSPPNVEATPAVSMPVVPSLEIVREPAKQPPVGEATPVPRLPRTALEDCVACGMG